MMAINSSPIRLHELLRSVAGMDVATMPALARESIMREAAKEFTWACAPLHELLLGNSIGDSKWLWQCEPALDYDNNWVASFALVKVDQLDAAMSGLMKTQMTAALFPGMKLTVDLFSNSHYSTGNDPHFGAHIKITMAVCGDLEMMIAKCYLEATKDEFLKRQSGMSIEVSTAENGTYGIRNPAHIDQAFEQIAEAARIAGEKRNDPDSIPEAVHVELIVDKSVSAMDLHRALVDFGNFFTSASNALQYA